MPAGRKRELQPGRVDDFAGALPSDQPPFEEVLLTPAPSRDGFRGATGCALVRQQPFQDVDRGRERRADGTVLRLAVPPAVLELLTKEAGDHAIHILIKVGTQCDGPAIDARLDLAAEERLPSVLPTAVVSDQRHRPAHPVSTGSTPKSRSSWSVGSVAVQGWPWSSSAWLKLRAGKHAPPAHWPSSPCNASSLAPQPSVATRARSAATTSAGAWTRSRITCQRMAGSESSSQSRTDMRVSVMDSPFIPANEDSAEHFVLTGRLGTSPPYLGRVAAPG